MNIRSFLAIALLGTSFSSLIEAIGTVNLALANAIVQLRADLKQLDLGQASPQRVAASINKIIGKNIAIDTALHGIILNTSSLLDNALAQARNAGNVALVDSALAKAQRFLEMTSLIPALQRSAFDPQGKLKQEIDHLNYMVSIEKTGVPSYRQ